MKILIVCGEYFNVSNGLSLSTQRFVKQFRRFGDEVRILASDRGGTPDYAVSNMKVPFVEGIMEKQNFHFANPDREVIQKALSWAEIVHVEEPFPLSVAVVKEAMKMGLPITGTFHLYPENMTASVPIIDSKLSNRNIMNIFRWAVFQYCDAIQCPTDKVKARLEQCGYRSRLVVISNGIPSEFIADEPLEIHHAHFTVISIGRYSNEKDQTTLIHAIAQARHGSDMQLILAGRGPLEEKYRELGKTLSLPPIMRFYSQDELRKEVRIADLYVHCAKVEIEGMSCMEAFAAGTVPLIAESELSSTSAYALSEESLYQAGNVEELASKLDWWYEHREQLPKMGRRYIDLARTFTTEICAEKVREMMQDSIFKKKSMVPKTD